MSQGMSVGSHLGITQQTLNISQVIANQQLQVEIEFHILHPLARQEKGPNEISEPAEQDSQLVQAQIF